MTVSFGLDSIFEIPAPAGSTSSSSTSNSAVSSLGATAASSSFLGSTLLRD
eukprot:CAMPEP_0206522034 /NCGR_PEP_ID=MMETSP0324_2-20121206/66731_1 /ASSEMBLY_ACC=CAM_ASM_000836 /TAXON_ID=2866 /ORGANISM="Crypthecodinium cohnii, Strain Seligo" /LENGTH=50 /DNA_ID=CAMNT_0054016099 /DNA_START=9 /DNA_END=161 /DNA_ORIENTATION=-